MLWRMTLCLALLLAFTPSAGAVNSLAFTMTLACNDADGVRSDEVLPIELPSGNYAVTVEGFCAFNNDATFAVTQGTPCVSPDVPCASVTVQNLPGEACSWSAGEVQLWGCQNVVTSNCSQNVQVNGQCVRSAGVVSHTGGVMVATFDDAPIEDNDGAFTITVVWTPL